MKDMFKWVGKNGLVAVFWVFALSVTLNGKTIFHYANETLVQNSFVMMLDEELGRLWDKVYQTARVTFDKLSESEEDQKT